MIKDKLHTITDEDAIEVAKILLKTSHSHFYNFAFEKITRINYDNQDGTDAEESVNVYFNATVNNNLVHEDLYRRAGWQDERVCVKLIESDRYHDYPYFYASSLREPAKKAWDYKFLSNHIEAIEYLQGRGIL